MISLGFIGLHWVLLGLDRLEWVFLGFTGFLLGFHEIDLDFYGLYLVFGQRIVLSFLFFSKTFFAAYQWARVQWPNRTQKNDPTAENNKKKGQQNERWRTNIGPPLLSCPFSC